MQLRIMLLVYIKKSFIFARTAVIPIKTSLFSGVFLSVWRTSTKLMNMKKTLCILLLFGTQVAVAAKNAVNTNPSANQLAKTSAAVFKPIAGLHYRDIDQTVAVSNQTVIFVWYGCNSCYQLEVQFAAENPNWKRIPVTLYKSWRPQTKLFYTARALNLSTDSDLKLMAALANGTIAIDDLDAQKDSLLNQQITESDVDKLYYSAQINQQAAFSDTLTRQIQIKKVPAALIGGKYYLDLSMVSGLQQFVDSVHFLQQMVTQPTLDEEQ